MWNFLSTHSILKFWWWRKNEAETCNLLKPYNKVDLWLNYQYIFNKPSATISIKVKEINMSRPTNTHMWNKNCIENLWGNLRICYRKRNERGGNTKLDPRDRMHVPDLGECAMIRFVLMMLKFRVPLISCIMEYNFMKNS
jgi:hypothetical protein